MYMIPKQSSRASGGILLGMAFLLVPGLLSGNGVEPTPEITAKELMDHVKLLADDDLQGRAAGSEGAITAAAYISTEYERLGLKPVGDDKTYFQNFTIPRGFKALPTTSLIALKDRKETEFTFGKDIYPLSTSASGKVEGAVVFAGYGISAPDFEFDEYEEIDVKGKIVIVLRGLPNSKSQKNPFRSRTAVNRYASVKAKQDTAAAMGAAGLILINDPVNFSSKSKDTLLKSDHRRQGNQGTIPSLHMTYAAGRKLVANTGISLGKFQQTIDGKLEPRSKEVSKLTLRLNAALEVVKLDVRNVVGLLEARAEDKKDEVLIIGAHFDHIGLGEFGSLGGSKARGQVHNGADDNASGTAGVMEIAGFLKPRAELLKRDVLFICFTAEEMGLLGSKHYVESPIIPIEKTAAMINLDMVSYLGKMGHLDAYGIGTAPSFKEVLKEANRSTRVKVKEIEGVGRGASDHYPFYQKGLPVFFFITGLHKNYHRPTDDWKNMDKRGFEKVVRLAGNIAYDLGTSFERPVFTPTTEGGLDTGPYLGVNLENRGNGVYVSNVAKGSPAYKRLEIEDLLLEVNDREIESMALFYGLWAAINPGEEVTFRVRRGTRTRSIKIKLKK